MKHTIKKSTWMLMLVMSLFLVFGLAACDSEDAVTEEPMDMDMESVETGVEVAHGDLIIKDIWGRPALEGNNGAAYFTIMNNGSESDKLVNIQSEVAGMLEVHESKVENDVMQMLPVEGGLEIPAGGHVQLAPGGYHVMMMELSQDVNPDQSYTITLEFEQAGSVEVEVMVMQP